MGFTDSLKAHPTLGAHDYFCLIPDRVLNFGSCSQGTGWGYRAPGSPGQGMGIVAHHKELTEGDVGEDVVCLILPADLLRLLPKVRELLC